MIKSMPENISLPNLSEINKITLPQINSHMGRVYSDLTGLSDGAVRLCNIFVDTMKQFGENVIIKSASIAGAYAVIPDYTKEFKQQETIFKRAQSMWNSIEWNKAKDFVINLPGAYVIIPQEYS